MTLSKLRSMTMDELWRVAMRKNGKGCATRDACQAQAEIQRRADGGIQRHEERNKMAKRDMYEGVTT